MENLAHEEKLIDNAQKSIFCLTVTCWFIASPLAVLLTRPFTGSHQEQVAVAAVCHFVINSENVACSYSTSWDTGISTVIPRCVHKSDKRRER